MNTLGFTTNEHKAALLRKLIPLNGTGTIYATTENPNLVVPASYRDAPSLGFKVDNHGLENEFNISVAEGVVSYCTTVDGEATWISIPLSSIYCAFSPKGFQLFDFGRVEPAKMLEEQPQYPVH
jgi:hypothetical protein